jgi:hypothetical protein
MFSFVRSKRRLLTVLGSVALAVTLLVVLSPQVQIVRTSKAYPKVVVSIGGYAVGATGSTDFSFTGTSDNIPFNAAIAALPSSGGEVIVVSPAPGYSTINFAASVTVPANVEVMGAGTGTSIVFNGSSPIFISTNSTDHFVDLKLDAGGISGAYSSSNLTIGSVYYALGNSATGRTASYVIAASDAPAIVKAQADYVCTGTSLTSGGDNVQIQAAINAGDNVYLSQGDFYLSAQINNGTQVSIFINGAGMGGGRNNAPGGGITTLWACNGLNTPVIAFNPVCSIATLSNFRIQGNHANQSSGAGIDSNAWYNVFTNIWVSDTKGNGITLGGIDVIPCSGIATNVWIDSCQLVGVQFNNDASDWTWNTPKIFSCVQHGFQITNGAHISIIGGDIYGNGIDGISIYGSGCRSELFDGVSINNNTGGGIEIHDTNATDPTQMYNITVRDCYFAANGGVWSFDLEGALGSIVINNNYCADTNLMITDNNTHDTGWIITDNQVTGSFGNIPLGFAVIKDNKGVNPVGKITNPIGTANIGYGGSGTTVTSATVYTVSGVDCFITSTGGGVSNIVIKDVGGNVMLTSVVVLTHQFLPIGYSVTWTWTVTAPTVTVFGN